MKKITLPTQDLLFPVILVLFLLGGCSGVRTHHPAPGPFESTPAKPPAEYKPVTGKGTALYQQALQALNAGEYEESEMLLERALRIEPQNPHYWYSMALAKYNQEQYAQTIQFCLKAESLSGQQPQIASRSRALLIKAQNAMMGK